MTKPCRLCEGDGTLSGFKHCRKCARYHPTSYSGPCWGDVNRTTTIDCPRCKGSGLDPASKLPYFQIEVNP